MKNNGIKFIKMMISVMLSVILLCPENSVWAKEGDVKSADSLALSVDYPSDIKCEEPVTFTMKATGGTGNYKYRIAALMDSELTNVYDISYGSNSSYKDSNEFTFTFYASGTYYIRFSVMDMTTNQTKMTGLYEYPIVIQDESHPSVEQIVNTITAECEKECSTDFEKALWLHDWILDHADYDYSYSYCSAEGVLARGEGTCESYHRAYSKLLNKVGIPTGRITGNGHVWTAVKMDGEWYQIDSTWDDKGAAYKDTYYEHMYFGLTDDIISLVHDEHTEAVPGYESTALENNYFIKTGEITQWSGPFVADIQKNIEAGQTEFILQISDSMPGAYKNVIYNLVAYKLSTDSWNNTKLSVSYADNQLICKVVQSEGGGETKPIGLTVYNGVDYSAVYDFNYYVANNGDVEAAFGNDEEGVLKHFVEYGMQEGRQAKEDFNVRTYRNRYSDIRAAYGKDWKAYYLHYINYGKAEGRSGYGQAEIVGTTVYAGIDYSAVYDFNYYISHNGDVKAVFEEDDEAAIRHFVEYGMAEGRQAINAFSVSSYRKQYADLRQAYRADLKAYYMHYINFGKAEGRVGSGCTTLQNPVSTYGGVDYGSVYDYHYYISKYSDVKKAYGDDDIAVLEHFLNYGVMEGRRGNASFGVYNYEAVNEDVYNAYRTNYKQAMLHYIFYGKREGRTISGRVDIYSISTLRPDVYSACEGNMDAIIGWYITFGSKGM